MGEGGGWGEDGERMGRRYESEIGIHHWMMGVWAVFRDFCVLDLGLVI